MVLYRLQRKYYNESKLRIINMEDMVMKLIKLTAKEAKALTRKLGLCWGDEQRTYYATNEERTEIWEYTSKADRDKACEE